MTVTGAGADYARNRGVAPSKQAAMEACNACSITLMSIEGNYERALAHHIDLHERMDAFFSGSAKVR